MHEEEFGLYPRGQVKTFQKDCSAGRVESGLEGSNPGKREWPCRVSVAGRVTRRRMCKLFRR